MQLKQSNKGFIGQITIVVEPGKNSFYQMTLKNKGSSLQDGRAPRQRWRLAAGVTVCDTGPCACGIWTLESLLLAAVQIRDQAVFVVRFFDSKGTGIAFLHHWGNLTLGGILLMSIPSGYRNIEILQTGFGDPC